MTEVKNVIKVAGANAAGMRESIIGWKEATKRTTGELSKKE